MKTRMQKLFTLLLALLCLCPVLAACNAKMDEGGAAGDPEGGYDYNNHIQSTSQAGQDDGKGFVENPFIATAENAVSTFSADVDTASYTYFRKLVNSGYQLEYLQKNSAGFRTEEFMNYFDYEAKTPENEELFGVTADLFACPWNPNTTLFRLTLQAENAVQSKGNNLVFLIDVSGSMSSKDKLPLLKKSFSYLVSNLTEHDTVSIVTYSGKEAVVLNGCPGNQGERIMDAINDLGASGSTNGEAGMTEAYRIAESHRIEGGNNRIIMASDGDLNVGISSAEDLKNYVANKREAGIYLSVLGFGTGNYRDSSMEAIADNGNGVYYYIDGETEAEKVFGTDLLGTLHTVAEDVKMQLTFDPKFVSSYRLIGYENRILATEDFDDDSKDAGEVGAGHQVTVCYELTLADGARDGENAFMKLAVRYKNPGEELSLLNEYEIGTTHLRETLDEDLTFLTCVIQTVMILHESQYLGNVSLSDVLETLSSLPTENNPLREEFCELVNRMAE